MFCEIPRVIRPKDKVAPVLKESIQTVNEMGSFDIFKDCPINHGFQWGVGDNVSYMKEPGHPEIESLLSVRRKVIDFTKKLNMKGESSVLAHTVSYNTTIIDIADPNILIDNGIQGFFTPEGGAFFTTQSRLPLYSIMGDCAISLFYGETYSGASVVGLIHSGRYETDEKLPYNSVKHAIHKYKLDPNKIKLGISPSLEPKYHQIQKIDISRHFNNFELWNPYSIQDPEKTEIHIDVRSYIADQFIEAGVPAKNIELCLSGTYESPGDNPVHSYRRSKVEGLPMSCLGIAVELQ